MKNFKVALFEKVHVLDSTKNLEVYIVVGRCWSKEKGYIYELRPHTNVAAEFYRLNISQRNLVKGLIYPTFKIAGDQYKKLEARHL